MSWGKIYDTSWWGSPTENDWGNSYYDYANPSPTPFFEVLAENGDYVITEQNEYVIIE
jgi:hypothetical protein